MRQQAFTDPWGALIKLERHGLDASETAVQGLAKLPDLVQRLASFRDVLNVAPADVARPNLETLDDHVKYVVAVLDAALERRENALLKIDEKDREFLHAWPARHVETFGPQLTLNDQTKPLLESDVRFCALAARSFDTPAFLSSVLTVLRLAEPTFLDSLRRAMENAKPIAAKGPDGLTGELLHASQTKNGWIIIGAKGKNTYSGKDSVAFLADLGGDDSYKGLIASSFDAKRPFSFLVDFAGNDDYDGAALGLATGRLGCGCLIDRAGDDTYKCAPGGGGCGFAGVGILVDESGKDTYSGTRFTLGAATAGIGLLLDLAGDDKYAAHGFSIAIGGPLGVGAVIDIAGDDEYKCGKHYPSGYNPSEAPNAKPGDANFQYDAFAMGIGLGRRLYPFWKEGEVYDLAGGFGVWIDVAGNDKSESSNFAQACAYYFGVGLKMDLAGNDRHGAARYGHASGAHYGFGAFLDYGGDDAYVSEGPTYNAGCAWDRSVFLLADASGADTYDLSKSSGPARGDHGGWGVFADLAGSDKYRINGTAGGASEKSAAVFYDGGGADEYPTPLTNAAVSRDGTGGLVVDR